MYVTQNLNLMFCYCLFMVPGFMGCPCLPKLLNFSMFMFAKQLSTRSSLFSLAEFMRCTSPFLSFISVLDVFLLYCIMIVFCLSHLSFLDFLSPSALVDHLRKMTSIPNPCMSRS
uniref:Uncharacterized protein n=1 Tax=Cacopsylla melanoneura TaxID=428564 RepID=A0A8D8RA33_9HEMI